MNNILFGSNVSNLRQEGIKETLDGLTGMGVYQNSIVRKDAGVFFLANKDAVKYLGIIYEKTSESLAECEGIEKRIEKDGRSFFLKLCGTNSHNADCLRKTLEFLSPKLIGKELSVGCGDRLGLATPGHVWAVREKNISPVFAQQSIREMTRTQRTAKEVMDDAMWGAFQEGYESGFGSDADHLKTEDDIDVCVSAGFTMFTIDPGAYVDNTADDEEKNILLKKYEILPFADIESSREDFRKLYLGKSFNAGLLKLKFTEEEFVRASVKYANAVSHTVKLYRHLYDKKGRGKFEVEVSVDETSTPTTVLEHFFMANELNRLGVEWASMAPRFAGDFEKGVDYKGDLKTFEKTFVQHVEIAKNMGDYKISLHSGSDKFSIYPVIARHCNRKFHLKTAGTSYLEALRVVAEKSPKLFREILDFAVERYDEDRKSYHVSADTSKIPKRRKKALDSEHGRQALHVTFGSVLTTKREDGSYLFRDNLMQSLRENENVYYDVLKNHIGRHIADFV